MEGAWIFLERCLEFAGTWRALGRPDAPLYWRIQG
jgi:hypothetical protein